MIHSESAFILPLMDHLVNQRVYRLVPSMSSDVTTTYHDLGALPGRIPVSVMSEPALHPARDAHWNSAQQPAESLAVERLMRAAESLDHGLVIRMRAFPNTPRTSDRRLFTVHGVRDKCAPRRLSRGTRFSLDELDDRAPRLLRCAEVAFMNANFIIRVAHEHSSVRRKAAPVARMETECHQPRPQLVSVAWTRLQLERQLRFVARSPAAASSRSEAKKQP